MPITLCRGIQKPSRPVAVAVLGHEPLEQARSLHALRKSALCRETAACLAASAAERASLAVPINLCQGRQKPSRPVVVADLGHEPLKQAMSVYALRESALCRYCRETAASLAAAAAERVSLAMKICPREAFVLSHTKSTQQANLSH